MQPEGELLKRTSHLQPDKAEGDIHLRSAFAEFPVVFFQILLNSGRKKLRGVDDQCKRRSCEGKRLLAFLKVEPALRAGFHHVPELRLTMGTEHCSTGKNLGGVFPQARFRVGSGHFVSKGIPIGKNDIYER